MQTNPGLYFTFRNRLSELPACSWLYSLINGFCNGGFIWKYSCCIICCAVGLLWGFTCSRLLSKDIASWEAWGTTYSSLCPCILFNSIPKLEANLYPSGHSYFPGQPSIANIFWSWSLSLTPGNKGKPVYSSAMMAPIAKISIGEL